MISVFKGIFVRMAEALTGARDRALLSAKLESLTLQIVVLRNQNREMSEKYKGAKAEVEEMRSKAIGWMNAANKYKETAAAWKRRHSEDMAAWKKKYDDNLNAAAHVLLNGFGLSQKMVIEPEFDQATIKDLLRLCHPDRHSGDNFERANAMTKKLLAMRKKDPPAPAPTPPPAPKKKPAARKTASRK